MADVSPLPHGPTVALDALRKAVDRLHEAVSQFLSGGGGAPVWVALCEALYWVAALDDEGVRMAENYFCLRDADPAGRTVGGLVYARNRHAHELTTTGEVEFQLGEFGLSQRRPGEPAPSPGRGPFLSIQMRWVPLDELPPPGRAERHDKDVMYRDHVGGRPLTHPFPDAVAWFECIVMDSSEGDSRTIGS